MREHQIVITLKPDQFLEVQRLARAANAKSMGIFVRQKLLAALGIEGSLQQAADNNVDVEEILADLLRLQSELKSFVAESLSAYPSEAYVDDLSDIDSSQLSLFEEAPNVVSPADEPVVDDLEALAEKTFAISPRLGEIGTPDDDLAAPEAPAGMNQLDPVTAPLPKHELHSRRDNHKYAHQAPADPYIGRQNLFANSQSDDPLSRLLSDGEASVAPPVQEAEEDTFDVPLSLAERRLQMSTGSGGESSDYVNPVLQPTTPAQLWDASETATDEGSSQAVETASIAQEKDLAVEMEIEPAQTSSASASPSNPPMQNETNRPLGHPPISGNPPPKRRQV